jgi:hypothetical protein
MSLAQRAAARLAVAPADPDIDRLVSRLRGGRSASARLLVKVRGGAGGAITVTRVIQLVS